MDVTDLAAVTDALRRTAEALGPVDHLVHAAAVGSGKFGFPFTNLTPDDWPRVLNVNVLGMANVAHAVAPGLVERQARHDGVHRVGGRADRVADRPAVLGVEGGEHQLRQVLARDLAPHGVRVNTVCPGMVRTPMNEAVWKAWHDRQPPESRKSYDDWAAREDPGAIPLGRWQRPEDVADMVVFLSATGRAR